MLYDPAQSVFIWSSVIAISTIVGSGSVIVPSAVEASIQTLSSVNPKGDVSPGPNNIVAGIFVCRGELDRPVLLIRGCQVD
jgi:hypothetical protein